MKIDLSTLRNIKEIVIYGVSHELNRYSNLFDLEYMKNKKIYVCEYKDSDLDNKFEKIKKQDIEANDQTLVVFATEDLGNISIWAKEFKKLKIHYISYHFLDTRFKVCAGVVQRLGYSEIVDTKGNYISVSSANNENYDKVFIRYQYSDLAHDNKVVIGKILVSDGYSIELNFLSSSGTILIGDNTSFVRTFLQVGKNGIIEIGDDCMFSIDTTCYQSDAHMIFDLKDGKRINECKNITVGNHVWIGRHSTILGGFSIGNNSVFGSHSVSSSKFGNNLVVAGSPAKVIREDIIWARDSSEVNSYTDYMQCSDKAGLKYLDYPLGYTYESFTDEIK